MQSLLALLPLRWPTLSAGWRTLAVFSVTVIPLCFAVAVLLPVGAYTASLSVFAVSSLAMATSLRRRGALSRSSGQLLVAWALLVPMGGALNLFFADDFFEYPNRAAVSGVVLPALDLAGVDWGNPIPIEELAFYGLGFLAMLLAYAWIDEAVIPRLDEARHSRAAWADGALIPAALVAAGVSVSDTFPAYWVYLCVVPLPPTLVLWSRVRHRLNRPALFLTVVVVAVVSFFWEAVFAVPRGWWGYQPEVLTGRTALGVPVEAVVVWVLAPVTTAVLYEFVRSRWRRS